MKEDTRIIHSLVADRLPSIFIISWIPSDLLGMTNVIGLFKNNFF